MGRVLCKIYITAAGLVLALTFAANGLAQEGREAAGKMRDTAETVEKMDAAVQAAEAVNKVGKAAGVAAGGVGDKAREKSGDAARKAAGH